MEIIEALITALWQQDFNTLANPSLMWTLYGILFVILFLENGLLPAAFLPGDSLLVLVGVLITKDALNFPLTILLLTTAASLGCWASFAQGKWLGNTRTVQSWMAHLPEQYHVRTQQLFERHGLSALLLARFLAFVRTLLPTLAGLSGMNSRQFHLFNWLSAFFWVLLLVSLGVLLGNSPMFRKYEELLMLCLMVLPIVLLVAGLIGSLLVLWRKKQAAKKDD